MIISFVLIFGFLFLLLIKQCLLLWGDRFPRTTLIVFFVFVLTSRSFCWSSTVLLFKVTGFPVLANWLLLADASAFWSKFVRTLVLRVSVWAGRGALEILVELHEKISLSLLGDFSMRLRLCNHGEHVVVLRKICECFHGIEPVALPPFQELPQGVNVHFYQRSRQPRQSRWFLRIPPIPSRWTSGGFGQGNHQLRKFTV